MKIAVLWITDKVNFEIFEVEKINSTDTDYFILSWEEKFLGRRSVTKYELGITLRPDEDSVDEYVVFDYPENILKMQIFLEKELNFEINYLEKEITSLKNKVTLLKEFSINKA